MACTPIYFPQCLLARLTPCSSRKYTIGVLIADASFLITESNSPLLAILFELATWHNNNSLKKGMIAIILWVLAIKKIQFFCCVISRCSVSAKKERKTIELIIYIIMC